MRSMILASAAFAAVAMGMFAAPAESHAQRRGGFGGGGYGRSGISIGFGNTGYGGYGRGLGYPGGYYGSGYGYGRPGVSVNIGRGFGNYGYGSGYSSGYSSSYYSAPAVVYSEPAVQNYSSYPSEDPNGIVQPSANYSAASMVVVYVPANAQLWWGNTSTTTTGVERRFATSPLGPQGGVETFQAQWMDANGQMHNEARQIRVMPGQTVALDFRQPAATNNPPQPADPNQNVAPNTILNRNVNPDDLPPEPLNR